MDRLTIEVPEPELRRRFRVWCINNGTTMKDEIVRFMKEVVDKEEKQDKRKKAG